MNVGIGMIFPGQNTQNIKKLLKLNNKNNIIKQTFEEASEYLKYNIWHVINKPNSINFNQYLQPIILTASVAIYKLWKNMGGENPVIAAGHSLGEYSALVCSNAITFFDGINLVKKRETIMKKQTQESEVQMQAIIGLNKDIVYKICKKNSKKKVVNIASINSENQIVISGYKEAVQKVNIECKNLGAKTVILPINIAAHCIIMKKIKRKFSKQIKKIPIQNTLYPLISSTSLNIQNSKNTIRRSLIKQLFKPVKWKKTMDIITKKINILLEVGTNNILTNLFKKNNSINIIPMNNFKNINLTLKLLHKKYHE